MLARWYIEYEGSTVGLSALASEILRGLVDSLKAAKGLVLTFSAKSASENASSGALQSSSTSSGPFATTVVPKGNKRTRNHPLGYWRPINQYAGRA